MENQRVFLKEMVQNDLPFLIDLWHNPEVMRYADEFPSMRGWSKSDDIDIGWEKYQIQRTKYGTNYHQLILVLKDGEPIGESFYAPLPDGYTFGKWCKPANTRCVMGDIKLLPKYWGQGLGTEGMQQVVRFVFTQTNSELFVVPPNRNNPAAIRVYEKAGFVRFTGMRSWHNHFIMELAKERFEEI